MSLNPGFKTNIRKPRSTKFKRITGNEEEEFEYTDSSVKSLIDIFMQDPFHGIHKLAKNSDKIDDISPQYAKHLCSRNFFFVFSKFLDDIEEIKDLESYLIVLFHFLSLETYVCVNILNTSIFRLLKKCIFHTNPICQELSLKCLRRVSKDSDECRKYLISSPLIIDLSSLILSKLNVKIPSSIISNICTPNFDFPPSDLNLIRCVGKFLFMETDLIFIGIKLLLFVSESTNSEDVEFLKIDYVKKFLDIFLQFESQNPPFSHLFLKFLACRTQFPNEAATFFEAGILPILAEISKSEERNAMCSCWVIKNILHNVPNSVNEFEQQKMFELIHHFIINGGFELKGAAVRVFKELVMHNVELFVSYEDIFEECLIMLESTSVETIFNVLEIIQVVVNNNKIELINEDTFNSIAQLSEHENEKIRILASNILESLTDENACE